MLITRWIITALVLVYVFVQGHKLSQVQGPARAFMVVYAAAGGLVLAILWARVIGESVGSIFGGLYDGGTAEVEPKPFYSIAQAKKTQGKYLESLAEVRRQLQKFPNDFEGMMLLSELQAENLDDLQGAEVTVQRVCSLGEQPPRNVAYALNRMADWHLNLHKNREAAKIALEKIIELLPETEMSLQASQRIAHLADTEMLLASQQRQGVRVIKGVENIGLLQDSTALKPAETDAGKLAAILVKHLEVHPLDTEARERLANIYASHYQRLDLAQEQLEQLINQPNQTPKNVVRWLNSLVDLQVQHGGELEQARQSLQRVMDIYPESPAAQKAERRMQMLKLEFKGKEKSQAVQLGSYEQDIGLKRRA
ncbi:tetratricopeptide repeat protein [Pedosphaera parvula]|nr:tetratricopeptide repeat protein [Pedosphaera parvula]